MLGRWPAYGKSSIARDLRARFVRFMLVAAGTVLEGKYRVARLLGAGGMGSVWIAEHQLLGRQVAVKILDASAKKDPTAVQRFLREAQTAARLRSDHIVDVLDVGLLEGGTPFLVME